MISYGIIIGCYRIRGNKQASQAKGIARLKRKWEKKTKENKAKFKKTKGFWFVELPFSI